MSSKQTIFFSTKSDLAPIMEELQNTMSFKFIEMGIFDTPEIRQSQTFTDIPDVGLKQIGDSVASEHRYMLVPKTTKINIREVPQHNGEIRFAIDPKLNPEVVELTPGGLYVGNENALIAGRVAYVFESMFTSRVYALIIHAMRLRFTKVGKVFVGNEAMTLALSGTRLTRNIKLSPEHDLLFEKSPFRITP